MAATLDALGPLSGRRVLDFACGSGVTTAWLAQRGALVTGLDIAPVAIDTARELCARLGLEATFVCADLEEVEDGLGEFDCLFGNMALHHLDVSRIAPVLARHLRPGGTAAFAETTYTNPLMRLARRHLVGRFGVPRIGSLDEKPLEQADFRELRRAFGTLTFELGEMQFLRILDRQLWAYRHRRIRRVCERVDDALYRWPATHGLSYHRVLVLRK